MLWVSLVIVSVFGGLTIAFHNPTFIKWKPTALYWLFACVLGGSSPLFGRNLIRKMLEAQVTLPDPVWSRLNMAWAGFFALMGFINLFVAYLQRGNMGQFQAVRRYGIDARVRSRSGGLSHVTWKRKNLMWYAVIAEDVPDSLAGRLAVRRAHLERLKALQNDGRLLLGPCRHRFTGPRAGRLHR